MIVEQEDVGGPGGFCDECGHFAMRHSELTCTFAWPDQNKVCQCSGMQWNGKRYAMDPRSGPLREVPM